MIYTTELVISLLLSGVGLFFGFYFKKKALLLSLGAGFLLIITAILILSQGFVLRTGDTLTVSGNTTIVNYVYEQADSTLSSVAGWFLLVVGFASLVGSSLGLYDQRFESEDI